MAPRHVGPPFSRGLHYLPAHTRIVPPAKFHVALYAHPLSAAPGYSPDGGRHQPTAAGSPRALATLHCMHSRDSRQPHGYRGGRVTAGRWKAHSMAGRTAKQLEETRLGREQRSADQLDVSRDAACLPGGTPSACRREQQQRFEQHQPRRRGRQCAVDLPKYMNLAGSPRQEWLTCDDVGQPLDSLLVLVRQLIRCLSLEPWRCTLAAASLHTCPWHVCRAQSPGQELKNAHSSKDYNGVHK